jgi:lipoprotein NlpD
VRAGAALLLCALLAACAGNAPAPIVDHSAPGASERPSTYRVLRGDTLFSIAFRYGLDYRRLAAANNIAPPYTIYAGQPLLLAEADPPAPRPIQKKAAPVAKPSPAGAPTEGSATPAASPQRRPAAAATVPAAAAAADNRPVSAWRWPAAGRVARRFDGARHKGIDIDGERGDEIRAVAGGRVVYAGSGIAGYGLMLIVRHNDEYLSAYGHNDVLLVEEGDSVRPGQLVARMGSSGTDSVKLHFELRRRGRPVDPLQLLPRR